MPHIRHIISENPLIPVMSLAIDETRAVLRFLKERTEDMDGLLEAPAAELSTTARLGYPQVWRSSGRFYTIEGKQYVIWAEGILDKNNSMFSKDWVPGAHFVFHFDPAKGFFIDSKGTLTYFNKRNTADLVRYEGGYWLFDLWVRNPQAPLTECARSLTTGADTILITNVEDLGEPWSVEDVMTGTTSKWLNLAYELTPSSETVSPDGWVDFTLTLKDGKTHEVATDVTWDGYIVEAVDGYAPHKRVAVTNGIGHFRAQALGLQDGESMRIKINHRFFTSRAEATVQVVAND